jgi:hypothetical protein
MRSYLKDKVAAPVYKAENTAAGFRRADLVAPSIRKKFASKFADMQRSLGRYSPLADSGHGDLAPCFSLWLFIVHNRLLLCSGRFVLSSFTGIGRVRLGQRFVDPLIMYAVCTHCVRTCFPINCQQMSQQSLDNETGVFMSNCFGGGRWCVLGTSSAILTDIFGLQIECLHINVYLLIFSILRKFTLPIFLFLVYFCGT